MSITFTREARIHWNKKHEVIYHTLRERGIFPQNSHILMFCASLGFKHSRKKELVGDTNDIRLSTFSKDEMVAYVTIAFSKVGLQLDKLDKIEEFKNIIEEYAEGGMEVFIEEFLEPYLIPNKDGSYILAIKGGGASDFEKDLLVFIYEESQNNDIF
ncbi:MULTISPECIES: hypothetical protein [Priestia]|uniref:hypothetical protein n=1 Tax=Priestia TaxID=2800373 RepID=UPI001ADB7897|nr:hypothetical protein [Priestia aryabhattai]QTL47335.1 hypothetical protein J5Z55_14650 [Priestia aryabhattai]